MDPCSTGANCHRALAAFALTLIAFGCSKPAPPAPQPPNVEVAEVIKRDVPIYVEAIGQTRGSTEIEVRARVEGFLEIGDLQGGHAVRKGQLLYTIDPRQFEAALVAGQGAAWPKRRRDLARYEQDVVRYEPLVAQERDLREAEPTRPSRRPTRGRSLRGGGQGRRRHRPSST